MIQSVPVVDGFHGRLLGENELQVKNWMTPSPIVIEAGQTYREALETFMRYQITCLPVVDHANHPIGFITMKTLLQNLVNNDSLLSAISHIGNQDFIPIHLEDCLLEISKLPYKDFPVIDSEQKLVGVLTHADILNGFSKYIKKLEHKNYTVETLGAILNSAYEGIAVVNEHGILQEFNEAYCRFTGIKREDAIGRHVTEVIENTKLHLTVQSGIPERGVLQYIQEHDMIVHRIPIWKNNRVVGAIGMLIFEGVTEIYHLFEKLQENNLNKNKEGKDIPNHSNPNQEVTINQIVGESEEITSVKRLARRAAKTSATVLITGDSGTGKELFAKSIHQLSPCSDGPFITVNCAAIPDNLFEAELFGYEEGSFTGARKGGKPGKFELANNGTLFLDEVGEMPLLMQSKLLRVLQEREVERVGGIKKYSLNIRIIAATNKSVEKMVENGEFREDLYYRLNIIRLHIPPLRERKQDIPLLLSSFVKSVCQKYQIPEKQFTYEAVSILMNYKWPGNIREMVNMMERIMTLTDREKIHIDDLPLQIRGEKEQNQKQNYKPYEKPVGLLDFEKNTNIQKEKDMIISVIKEANGNKSKAAKLLGIHRTTLYQKLKRYNIQ